MFNNVAKEIHACISMMLCLFKKIIKLLVGHAANKKRAVRKKAEQYQQLQQLKKSEWALNL